MEVQMQEINMEVGPNSSHSYNFNDDFVSKNFTENVRMLRPRCDTSSAAKCDVPATSVMNGFDGSSCNGDFNVLLNGDPRSSDFGNGPTIRRKASNISENTESSQSECSWHSNCSASSSSMRSMLLSEQETVPIYKAEVRHHDEGSTSRSISSSPPSDRQDLSEPPDDDEYLKYDEDELYHPEDNDEDDDLGAYSLCDYRGATFNINNSREVTVGNVINYPNTPQIEGFPKMPPLTPQPETPTTPFGGMKVNVEGIPINTASTKPLRLDMNPLSHTLPVVSSCHTHTPVHKSQSTPVTSSIPSANTPTYAHNPLTTALGATAFNIPPNLTPITPTLTVPQTPSHVNIKSPDQVVVGTQYKVIVSCNNQHQHAPSQHKSKAWSAEEVTSVLQEVRETLTSEYKRQTKTSLLPWLRGHQAIPVTDFYTDSRILAVDKQGKQTRMTVDLVNDLTSEEETRLLVEGEPGMGKTLLALKMAVDWAYERTLQEYKFVFLIFLRDFRGSLEQYITGELLPRGFEEKFKQVWEYCKKHEEQVLFILDGYDELQKADEGEIQNLLRYRDFQKSKVVMTSRPNVVKIRTNCHRTIVKGFSEAQIMEFIGKYFKLSNEEECGRRLKQIIERDYKYRKLAKRPLFCVLLCMLYDSERSDTKLPEKLSDIMFKFMLCLIKWNNDKQNCCDGNLEKFPPVYQEIFLSFGKLSVDALNTEKTRFSETEISPIENHQLLLPLGFLSCDSEKDVLGPKRFYRPVHKIFMEYLAGYYIADTIEKDRRGEHKNTVYKNEYVLKFIMGILGEKAHFAMEGKRKQDFLHMKDQEVLMLLREAGTTPKNCRAVAKLLDRDDPRVYTSEVDFEGWSFILDQEFSRLKNLEIVWRIKSSNPDQESSFNEASLENYRQFFKALKSNTSINKIRVRATQDGEPFSKDKIELFFSHFQDALEKENLRVLEIKELNMSCLTSVSSSLTHAIVGATDNRERRALESLEVLKLDMFLDDKDLGCLCERLRMSAPRLCELQLTGLVHGNEGFKSLVELLKKNKNLKKLYISMNKARLQHDTGVFLSQDYTPKLMKTELLRMSTFANRSSQDAFAQNTNEGQGGNLPDPTKELSYLFQDPLKTKVEFKHGFYRFCYIIGDKDMRLPLPLCMGRGHKSVFHDLFSSLPETNVETLTLADPCLYLSVQDLVCLGDAIRKAKHLKSLTLTGLNKIEGYMPVLLGIGQSPSLTTVKLDSRHVVLGDTAFFLACTALRRNTTLRKLSLARWSFNIQDRDKARRYIMDLLSSWKVADLNLEHSNIDIGQFLRPALMPMPMPILFPVTSPMPCWASVKMLRLPNVKVMETHDLYMSGHLLLPMIKGCHNLSILDLSASLTNTTTLDDKAACKFFELLGKNFKRLKELTLRGWQFKFQHYEDTCQQIGQLVRSCSELRKLTLDEASEVRSGLSPRRLCNMTFLHNLAHNLPRLTHLSLCKYHIDGIDLDRNAATRLGNCFHDHWNTTARFELTFFGLHADVQTALQEALKRVNYVVKMSQESPLISFKARKRCFFSP